MDVNESSIARREANSPNYAGVLAVTIFLFSAGRLEILSVARSRTFMTCTSDATSSPAHLKHSSQKTATAGVSATRRVFHRLLWHCRSNRHKDSFKQLEYDAGTWNTSPCSTVMESRCHGNRRVKDKLRGGRMNILKHTNHH